MKPFQKRFWMIAVIAVPVLAGWCFILCTAGQVRSSAKHGFMPARKQAVLFSQLFKYHAA
jgi:hypothetical protein